MRLAVLAAVVISVLAQPAAAGRLDQPGTEVRLLFAGVSGDRADVGLEIALQPGWKTYWRHPGDAGIPPHVDTAGSTNLAEATVRFPMPVRFEEAGLTAIGYTAPVILPLDLRLADPKKPAELRLDVQIGLCHEICVPLEVKPTLVIDPAVTPDPAVAARLAAARAALPQPVAEGGIPRIVSLARDDGSFPPSITVEVLVPSDLAANEADLFVEGPTSEWALPVPTQIGTTGNPRLWSFGLDGAPSGADLAAAHLRFTFRAGPRAVEQNVGLDGAGAMR